MTHTEALAQFSLAVRESSLKRLRKTPQGKECVRLRRGGMNIAEIGYHHRGQLWLHLRLVGAPEYAKVEPTFEGRRFDDSPGSSKDPW